MKHQIEALQPEALQPEALQPEDLPLFDAHFKRHCAESGVDNFHFMPFAPGGPDRPMGLDAEGLKLSLDTLNWQRWFVAFDEPRLNIVGHVDLKGDHLKTGLHRCDLGIGIEAEYRGQGLGKQLMALAIRFCREAESLAWLDLKVFGHNTEAIALYRGLGFTEIGVLKDRFRIDGISIDDIIMTMSVTNESL